MKRASKLSIAVTLALAACVPVYAAAMININTASQAQLDTLKGIGPTYAARIIAYRNTSGPFKTIEDIQNVKGIGPITFAGIKDSISVDYVAPAPTPKAAAPASKSKVSAPAKSSVRVPAATKSAAAGDESDPVQLAAAAGESNPGFPLAASLVGLFGLVGMGAAGVWHVRNKTPKPAVASSDETLPSADEFKIE